MSHWSRLSLSWKVRGKAGGSGEVGNEERPWGGLLPSFLSRKVAVRRVLVHTCAVCPLSSHRIKVVRSLNVTHIRDCGKGGCHDQASTCRARALRSSHDVFASGDVAYWVLYDASPQNRFSRTE